MSRQTKLLMLFVTACLLEIAIGIGIGMQLG